MPGDERKISRSACVLLVVLRLAIGWHLMYEGLWKLSTQHTPQPWWWCTLTRSPGLSRNTPGPTASTTPHASWPRTWSVPSSRRYTCRSEPQMPAAMTCRRTSP